MANDNPYQTPAAALGTPQLFDEVTLFSATGRIGRLRFIAYGTGFYLIAIFVVALASAAANMLHMEIFKYVVMGLGYTACVVLWIMLAIQRCHDFNQTGWLALVALIPLVGLIFYFVRGTDGPNRFGNPPPANTTGVTVIASVLLVLVVAGIFAAIALPAYRQNIEAAEAQNR